MTSLHRARPGNTPRARRWALCVISTLGALPGCRGCRDHGDVLPTSDVLELAGCEETTVYLDQDGDGYGDPSTAMRSCSASASVVGNALDCDDANPALSPEAEAVCTDNLDNDCDGEPDCPGLERRTGLDEATAVMVDQYQSSSGYGVAIADLTGDGVMDLLIGSPDAEEGDYRGRVRLAVGPVSGQIDLTSDDVPDVSSNQDNQEGAYVAAGNMDGDAYVDLVMGVVSSDREENGVYIVSGPVLGEYDIDHEGATYLNVDYSGSDTGGRSEVMTGDIYEGDGQRDLLLDIRRANAGAGSAYFVPGPITEAGSIVDLAETALHAPSDEEEDGINNVDIIGDINGDGLMDVAGMDDGILHLIYELPPGNLSIADVAAVTIEADYENLGDLFGNPGDVDGSPAAP